MSHDTLTATAWLFAIAVIVVVLLHDSGVMY